MAYNRLAHQVENPDLDGRIRALVEREDAGIDADESRGRAARACAFRFENKRGAVRGHRRLHIHVGTDAYRTSTVNKVDDHV